MRVLCLACAVAAWLSTGSAWAGMTHLGISVSGYFARVPGTTSDPNDPNRVFLASRDPVGNPSSNSVTVPNSIWTDNGAGLLLKI